ncbi:hypothetical protein evm_011362, partial [Chilo suppressalis]
MKTCVDDRSRSGRPRPVRTPAVIKAVKARILRNPKRKQKLLALQMGLSRTTVKRLLNEDLGLRAYRRKTGHRLNARLMDLRLKRCRALLKRYAGKKYRDILFSQEKKFTVEESYNKQNDKVYAHSSEEASNLTPRVQRGVSPDQLSGKKVGVYIGTCVSETEKAGFYDVKNMQGFGIPGCNKAMFANRISYWLNLRGPSMSIDEACCSSSAALDLAYQAMSKGECEAAIVGGANLLLHPETSIHTGRIISVCPDGKTRSFDANGNGCALSEAIPIVFLQKSKNALRAYAKLIHMKNEYIGTQSGSSNLGLCRNPAIFSKFLMDFYDEAKVAPEDVKYVEAVGIGIPDSDKAELEAISKVFCNKNRTGSLLLGSVISKIGYTAASMGLCSLIKVLLAYHTGKIPANLHYSNPPSDVPALQDGRIRIVTEHEPFTRGYIGINNHSITGCSTHLLMNSQFKPK